MAPCSDQQLVRIDVNLLRDTVDAVPQRKVQPVEQRHAIPTLSAAVSIDPTPVRWLLDRQHQTVRCGHFSIMPSMARPMAGRMGCDRVCCRAGVMELADIRRLKRLGPTAVRVRTPPPAFPPSVDPRQCNDPASTVS